MATFPSRGNAAQFPTYLVLLVKHWQDDTWARDWERQGQFEMIDPPNLPKTQSQYRFHAG